MKLIEKMKCFYLKKMDNGGFTLVELIVVIAILAILAGVAVPAYSGYVEKANKQADMQLVSDVEQALSIQYYQNGGQEIGYVVLGTKPSANSFGEEAMIAMFGDNWKDMVELKYDGWKINTKALNAALNSTNPAAVGNNTYLNNSNVTELLDNVQTVTAAASGLLGTVAKTPTDYINSLNAALGTDYMDKAVSAGIMKKGEDGKYSFNNAPESGNMNVSGDLQAQLSNLMVFSVANELQNASAEEIFSMAVDGDNPDDKYSTAAVMAAQYAVYKAVAFDAGLEDEFSIMNEALSKATNLNEAQDALAGFQSSAEVAGDAVYKYCTTEADEYNPIFLNDASALSSIMQGVDAVSPDYTSGDVLKNSSLYTSGAVVNDLNTYISATELAARLSQDELKVLKEMNVTDGIIVVISGKGETIISPAT